MSVFTDAIADDKGLGKSGIIQKLIISAPKPFILCQSDEKRGEDSEERGSLVAALYAIKKLHLDSNVNKYTFTANAKIKFREYEQEFKEHTKNSVYSEPFIQYYNLNKKTKNLIRVRVKLKFLNITCFKKKCHVRK